MYLDRRVSLENRGSLIGRHWIKFGLMSDRSRSICADNIEICTYQVCMNLVANLTPKIEHRTAYSLFTEVGAY